MSGLARAIAPGARQGQRLGHRMELSAMLRKLLIALLGVCLLGVATVTTTYYLVAHGYWPNAGVKHPQFDDALLYHQGIFGLLIDRRLAQAHLRYNVLVLARDSKKFESRLTQIRETFARKRLPADFQDAFEAEVAWYRRLRKRDPNEVYAESKRLKARYEHCVTTQDASCYTHEWIAEEALEAAAGRGHLEARFDVAQKSIEEDALDPEPRSSDPYLHAFRLVSLADDDYLPAQLDLAERNRTGRRVKQDLRLTWYWYHRARNNGGDVSPQLNELESKLTAEDMRLIRKCLIFQNICIGWDHRMQCLSTGRCPLDR